MTIFDDARSGTLNAATLTYDELNSQDPTTGWTLLATAVVSGYPNQVEKLLEKGAKPTLHCRDGETPLLLAAWKTTKERPLIVQKLLLHVPKENIDDTCQLAEYNTPLMCAIEHLDVDSVRLLAKAGARLHIKNDAGFNAVEVAKNTGKRSLQNALEPEKEQTNLMRLASTVIIFMRHVVSWVNDKFQNAMGKIFNFIGERNDSIDKTLKERESGSGEPTPEEFVKLIDTYVKEKPMLNTFFKDNKEFIQDVAKKAVDLAKDTSTDLGCEEVLPKTIQVTMHQQVIYCDDSGSMVNKKGTAEKRWDSQVGLALRIARTTTKILPDGEGVALRFINQMTDESPNLDFDGIGQALSSINPRGDTAIGTTLRDRILEPMVYKPLSEGSLKRPLLVSILTDGGPSHEDNDTLVKVIIQCGEKLKENGRPSECVRFLVGQIGSSNEAVRFLEGLKEACDNNPTLSNVLHIFAGRLDEEFTSFRDERKLDRWLIETLFKPLATGENI